MDVDQVSTGIPGAGVDAVPTRTMLEPMTGRRSVHHSASHDLSLLVIPGRIIWLDPTYIMRHEISNPD